MATEIATARRLFTREEYRRMAEVGILKPTDHVELIRGEIITMSPPARRHVAFVNNLTELLVVRLTGRAIVSVQNPVALSEDSEPQPDLAVWRRRPVPYKEREAVAEDTLLLIEVAETSLRYDGRPSFVSMPRRGSPSTGWSTVSMRAWKSIVCRPRPATATFPVCRAPASCRFRRFPTLP